jgi:hypothetical protein
MQMERIEHDEQRVVARRGGLPGSMGRIGMNAAVACSGS